MKSLSLIIVALLFASWGEKKVDSAQQVAVPNNLIGGTWTATNSSGAIHTATFSAYSVEYVIVKNGQEISRGNYSVIPTVTPDQEGLYFSNDENLITMQNISYTNLTGMSANVCVLSKCEAYTYSR